VAFTYLKVKSDNLLPVVLVLLFWSWSSSCKQLSWSWSCYFGLGLKNLVLFTSLVGGVLVQLFSFTYLGSVISNDALAVTGCQNVASEKPQVGICP